MIGWVNISLYEWRGGRRFARLNLNGTHGQRCLRLGRPRLVSRDNREEWGCGILSSPVGWGKTHGIPSFRWVEYSDFLVFSLSTWGRLMTPTTFDSRWYIIRIIPIWQPLRPTGRSGGGNALQKLELFHEIPMVWWWSSHAAGMAWPAMVPWVSCHFPSSTQLHPSLIIKKYSVNSESLWEPMVSRNEAKNQNNPMVSCEIGCNSEFPMFSKLRSCEPDLLPRAVRSGVP